jgi:hypothetical protein
VLLVVGVALTFMLLVELIAAQNVQLCMLVELLYMLLVVGAVIHVLAISIALCAPCGATPPSK